MAGSTDITNKSSPSLTAAIYRDGKNASITRKKPIEIIAKRRNLFAHNSIFLARGIYNGKQVGKGCLKSFAPCDIVVTNYLGTYAMNKWDKRFMEMARLVSSWSSCYKENRQVGAVIVRDKRILTTGYNGAGSGIKSCKERGECIRVKRALHRAPCHEICYAVHAEQNAIIQAAKIGVSVDGAILYCTHQPLQHLRQNDYKQRHKKGNFRRRLPG